MFLHISVDFAAVVVVVVIIIIFGEATRMRSNRCGHSMNVAAEAAAN